MTILCGTDFSQNATRAVQVAAALAQRLGDALTLVHIVDELGAELAEHQHEAVHLPMRRRVEEQAQTLAGEYGIRVEPLAQAGVAHKKLIELAALAQARLIVVSALSQPQPWWSTGSVAERVAQTSPVPVLLVRQAEPLLAWARGERPLNVMVGVEPGTTSRAALEFAAGLREFGPCDLSITQIVWPAGECYRFGVAGAVPMDHLRPELEKLLLDELKTWAGPVPGSGRTAFLVRPGVGRIDGHLTLCAAEASADLVVVGTHQRSGVARLWQASVSRGVVHGADTNVLCVPRPAHVTAERTIPSYRSVLVATDLSELSNRAVSTGYGLMPAGGLVHLVHVRTPHDASPADELLGKLRDLIPAGAVSRGINSEVHVLQDETASLGICRAAKRLGVDAICMATHGRGGLARVVLGSAAGEVLQRAEQPVVLVPPRLLA